ncbi:hypothetical protein ACVIST_004789 [Bradyrhizobium elkanii]
MIRTASVLLPQSIRFQRLDRDLARLGFSRRRNRVLQIEEDEIGGATRGALEEMGRGGGNREFGTLDAARARLGDGEGHWSIFSASRRRIVSRGQHNHARCPALIFLTRLS